MCPLPWKAPEETLDSEYNLSPYNGKETGEGQLRLLV